MKQALAIALCLCLFLVIYGCTKRESVERNDQAVSTPSQSVNDQLGGVQHSTVKMVAPDTYQATWLSNTGKTIIHVDALVVCPDVQETPVFEVAPRAFTREEVFLFAEAVFEGREYTGDSDFVSENGALVMNLGGTDQSVYYKDRGYMSEYRVTASPYKMLFGRYRADKSVQYSNLSMPLGENGWAEGATLSPDAARDEADMIARAFAPELECVRTAAVRGEKSLAKSSESIQIERTADAYCFYYTRPYAGVSAPYYTDQELIALNVDDAGRYISNADYETLRIVISDWGLEQVEYRCLHETLGVLNASPELLTFEQIIEIAKAVLPLKYATQERMIDVEYVLDEISFGYARVRMRDDPSRFAMIPAWNFYGLESSKSNRLYMLTISALDGTVIDPTYGY